MGVPQTPVTKQENNESLGECNINNPKIFEIMSAIDPFTNETDAKRMIDQIRQHVKGDESQGTELNSGRGLKFFIDRDGSVCISQSHAPEDFKEELKKRAASVGMDLVG